MQHVVVVLLIFWLVWFVVWFGLVWTGLDWIGLDWKKGTKMELELCVSACLCGFVSLWARAKRMPETRDAGMNQGAWREMEGGRESVKGVATRLKGLLDENGKTYRGGRVYVP